MGEASTQLRVIALDDDQEFLASLARALSPRGFRFHAMSRADQTLAALRDTPEDFDLVILDVQMPEVDGLTVLREARKIAPDLPVIMLSGDTRAGTATAALKGGAFDYLTKPITDFDAAVMCLNRAGQHTRLKRRTRALESRLNEVSQFHTIIGQSPAMQQIYTSIDKLAETSVNVLVLGESGTGKELVARAIHDRSERTHEPFVAINCAGLPETLIDSELFGHAKGAFTGAVKARPGAFEHANKGTLFLDEIGDLPLSVQGRLLRVLQEGELRALGQDISKKIDVRLIAATLLDLEEAVAQREFRNDLYYRLNVVSVTMPPLRTRMEDLPLLVAFFLRKHGARLRKPNVGVSPEALQALGAHDWPGNVRELENAIQRALALCDDAIDVTHLPPGLAGVPNLRNTSEMLVPVESSWTEDMSFNDARTAAQRDFEQTYLSRLMTHSKGNVSLAARKAGMDRSNFRKLLQRNGVHSEDFRRAD
ncbi:MAG TPA: sigma-54 dependent transcriptional regulator [Kofleriaceae bacterium]|nr:sigma-54 dependent transcriptional regulator [Kofleriaceae bacterium]